MKRFALMALMAMPAWGSVQMSDASTSINFLAIGNPGFLKVRGKLPNDKKVSGAIDFKDGKVTGSFSVPLNEFDTERDMRNQHMREIYLETAKYPEAKLVLKPIDLKTQQAAVDWSGPFEGTLSLHGVDKPVTGTAKLNKKDGKWSGEFAFGLELTDFNIKIPSFMGVTVSKSVKVEAAFKQ